MKLLELLLLFLLLGTSLGPGIWLTARLRWGAAERLCAAIGASAVFLYLAAWLIYVLGIPRAGYSAVAVACVVLGILGLGHARRLWADRDVRWAAGSFVFLVCWTLLFLAMVRNHSGAEWRVDWHEHFGRTRFFLEHQPLDTRFGGYYALPARPPLMNVLGAHFLGVAGTRYEFFQVTFAVLNLVVFFPCWLIARQMAPRRSGRAWRAVLLGLLALSPMLLGNANYTATKGLTNAFVILGIAFYLRGWHRSDPARLAAAGLAFGAGILAHYSAAPYAVLVALHYLVFGARGKGRGIRPPSVAAAVPGLLLIFTWVAWSLLNYGTRMTFGSNSTAEGAVAMSGAENLGKIGLNVFYSVVPHPLRMGFDAFSDAFFQPSGWGLLRDYHFTMVQTGLIAGMGCVGGLVVLYLLVQLARGRLGADDSVRRFWVGLAVVGAVCTIATHPTVDRFGVAHVCSQPLVLLGVTFLAARFALLPIALRTAVIAGASIDFAIGIFVHFSLQNPLPALRVVNGQSVLVPTSDLLSGASFINLADKKRLGLQFVGDHAAALLPVAQAIALLLFCLLAWKLLRAALPAPAGVAPLALALAAPLGAVLVAAMGSGSLPSAANRKPEITFQEPALAAKGATTAPLVARGLELYGSGQVVAAVETWTLGFLLDPNAPAPRYFAEMGSLMHGLPTTEAFRRADAVRRLPDSAAARYYRAIELWERRQQEPALAEMQEAVRLQPDLAGGQTNLGRMSLALGRIEEGVAAFSRALAQDPQNPDLLFVTALALNRAGRTEEALAHLREALRLRPDFPQAKNALEQIGAR